ncbi:MAG: hypothetical protein DRP08_07255 [Candidatus Aenigmatarchaeota archaeon]|nr:MAG: hypothetical protein DRP08_07255 [Candidatus Aenigmarchaeota archaeon]
MDSFRERGGAVFVRIDHSLAVKGPGNNDLRMGSNGEKILDVSAFGKKHQIGMGKILEERD